jgi:hypothetical protein
VFDFFDHPHVSSAGGHWDLTAASAGEFGIRRVSNGSLQVIWTCPCGMASTPIPHAELERIGIVVRELPIVADYTGWYARCIVRGCESDEVEWNHIAPKEIFGEEEAERWGMVALCRRHHQEWHDRMAPRRAIR